MEYFRSKRQLVLSRKLSELDKFVFDFVRVFEKYAEYVIISGYV